MITCTLIVNRQFYCSEERSTFSISYQYVYCRPTDKYNFNSTLMITVGDANQTYEWYSQTGANVPLDVSSYEQGSSFNGASDSNTFECVNMTKTDNGTEHNINEITVTYEYPWKVNSTERILVHISSFLGDHNYWFMVGDVQIRCLGLSTISICQCDTVLQL